MVRLLSKLTMASVLLAVSSSPAVGGTDANTGKAKQLYEEGVTNYNLSHFEEALTAFEMAYRLRQDAALLFNIAQCQRNLKRYEQAQRTFRAYLRESPKLPPTTRAQIQQIVAEIDQALTDERAKPPGGTQPPATTPRDEGAISANQPPAASLPPMASDRSEGEVAAKPSPDPALTLGRMELTPRPAARGRRRPYQTAAIGLVVAGVAFLGAGGGLASYSSSLYSQARVAAMLGEQRDLKNRSDVTNEAAWPILGVGCAAIIGSAALLAVSFSREHRDETRAMVQR